MEESKKAALSYIEQHKYIFTGLADYIWAHPELSLKEYKSAAYYEKVLEEGGFTVEKRVDGIETAFTGSYGTGHPIIGILGEFDALSGLSQECGVAEHHPLIEGGAGHGCGHNMLGSGALTAAFAIKHYLETSGHKGTVIFYGCPGEEGGAAKAFMARDNMWRSLEIRKMDALHWTLWSL